MAQQEKDLMSINRFDENCLVELKFYRSDQSHPVLNGRQSLIGFYNGLIVFPDYINETYDQIMDLNLIGKTLRVQLREQFKEYNKGHSFATIVTDPLQAIVNPQNDIFDSSPIVLVDGQNFIKDVINLNKRASAYNVLISILKKFKLPPQKIILYACKKTYNRIGEQLQEIENKAKDDSNYQIKINYRKPKFINTEKGCVIKTDIDSILQTELGILAERTKKSDATILLFAGDSDYERICRQWLGEAPIFLEEYYDCGRKLAIASSFLTKSFSSNLREVCNNPNAEAIRIEDYTTTRIGGVLKQKVFL